MFPTMGRDVLLTRPRARSSAPSTMFAASRPACGAELRGQHPAPRSPTHATATRRRGNMGPRASGMEGLAEAVRTRTAPSGFAGKTRNTRTNKRSCAMLWLIRIGRRARRGKGCAAREDSHHAACACSAHNKTRECETSSRLRHSSVHCKAWTCAAAELFHLVPAPSQGAKPGRLGLIWPELSWSCTCKDDRSPNVLSTSAMVTTTTSIAERHTHRVLFSTLQIGPVDLKQNCLTHNFTEFTQQA